MEDALFTATSAVCVTGLVVKDTAAYWSPFGQAVILLLIQTGGIDFLTWDDMLKHGKRFKKYRMQSKVVIVTTAVLIAVPTLLYFVVESAGHSAVERVLLSLFQSITPRTAGFNTADLGKMSEAGTSLMILLILVGGSPGSTAGGVKTTTLTVLLANASSVCRRKKDTQLFRRRILRAP